MKNSLKRTFLLLFTAATMTVGYAFHVFLKDASATDYCTSEACIQARNNEAAASQKATEASNTALTYENEVKRLNTEISAKEAQIAATISRIDSLTKEIDQKIKELTEQKSSLASVLNNMKHDNETELIIQIASSKNIADLTEKQARANTVKTQIALSAQKIEETKKELEAQKEDLEVLKNGQVAEQANLAAMRNEQANLQAKYENDASAFAADAEEARRIQAEEVAKAMEEERRRLAAAAGINGAAVNVYTNAANDTYAYRSYCPQNDGNNLGWGNYFAQFGYTNYFGGFMCECVSYAGYKAYETWHGKISGGKEAYAPWNVAWGNAISWGWSAAAYGYHVSSVPVAHSVAVWPIAGVGHVQWVEAVDSNYGIYISEYNNYGTSPSGMYGDYGEDYWSAYEYQSAGFQFIYFD